MLGAEATPPARFGRASRFLRLWRGFWFWTSFSKRLRFRFDDCFWCRLSDGFSGLWRYFYSGLDGLISWRVNNSFSFNFCVR